MCVLNSIITDVITITNVTFLLTPTVQIRSINYMHVYVHTYISVLLKPEHEYSVQCT